METDYKGSFKGKAEGRFLDYLWGMETSSSLKTARPAAPFLDYLWGMETIISTAFLSSWISFLDYLWGMETPFVFQVR